MTEQRIDKVLRKLQAHLFVIGVLLVFTMGAVGVFTIIQGNAAHDLSIKICHAANGTRIEMNHRIIAETSSRNNLIHLLDVLAYTRQVEHTAFAVFYAVTVQSVKNKPVTPALTIYLNQLQTVTNRYSQAAAIDRQIRVSEAQVHYDRLPLLNCSTA